MNQFAKMNKDKHLRGTRMKNFLKINLLSLTIFFTACNQLHIENVAEIHGYYATDDNEFIVIVSPEYLARKSARSAAYRKKHNLEMNDKVDYHITKDGRHYYIILGPAGTRYSGGYEIIAKNKIKNGVKLFWGLIDETTVFEKIPDKDAERILASWGYDLAKIQKADFPNRFDPVKRRVKGTLLYDTAALRASRQK